MGTAWFRCSPGPDRLLDAVMPRASANTSRRPSSDRLPSPKRPRPQGSPVGLRTDLAMAREEIKELRVERDQLRAAMRQHLGHQLDQISNRKLTERITELTEANRKLERELAQLRPHADRIQELQQDLAAARTSLRQMIRDGNQHKPT